MDRRCAAEGRRIRGRRQQPPPPDTPSDDHGHVTSTATPYGSTGSGQHGEAVQVELVAAARRPRSAPGRSARRRRSPPARRPPAARRPARPTPGRPGAGTPGAAGPRWRGAAAPGAAVKARHGERRAAAGERRVRQRDPVGQQPACRRGGRLDVRRPARPGAIAGCASSRTASNRSGIPAVVPGDDEPAEQAGRRVVRVPLHPGRDLQQRRRAPGSGRARRAPPRRPHRRRRRRPSCRGRARAGSRCGSAGAGRAARRRRRRRRGAWPGRRGARSSRGTRRRPRPSTSTVSAVGRDGDLDLVVQAQRQPEGVEPGPEVGRRRRHPHPDRGGTCRTSRLRARRSPQLQRVRHRTAGRSAPPSAPARRAARCRGP